MSKDIISEEIIHVVPEDGNEEFDVVEVEYAFDEMFPNEEECDNAT